MTYALFILVLQLALAAHVLRHGRSPWWILAFILLPGLSSAIYLLGLLLGAPAGATLSYRPPVSLSDLQRAYQRTPSITTALALGEALIQRGRELEALAIYQAQGDRDALLLQARAALLLELGRIDAARQDLERLYALHGTALPEQTPLLRARILDATEDPGCEQAYRALLSRPGPEVRCRLAEYLARQGRHEEADGLYRSIIESARDNGRAYGALYATWIERARRGLRR